MVIFIFTLGNSSDVFLLLKAQDSGLQVMFMPILWSVLHISKSLFSIVGANLSDKFERKKILISGWIIYAAVHLAFGLIERVTAVWVLFAIYGIHFGFTESVQKAIIADIVKTEEKRGTAYGIYNFVIGIGNLPASILFGIIWSNFGSQWAFFAGAGIAFISIVMATFINLE